MLTINPAWEAGKKAAADALALQRTMVTQLQVADGPQGAAKLAEAAGSPEATITAYKILEHLAANQGSGVRRVGGTSPADALFASE